MTRTVIIFFILLGAYAALMTPSCSSDTVTSPSEIIFPDSNVSYNRHLQPLFNLTCTSSGCHDDVSRQGNLALTSYGELIQSGDVTPGDANGSVLVQKIEGKLPHSPAGISQLNQNHKRGIRRWIDEGAKQN